MAPDVMEAAKAAIEALGYGPVLLTRLAASRGHDDAVVLRPMPTADAVRHMDGTRRVGYVLQVIVKDTSEAKAMGDAYDLADALDGADLSSPTGSYGFTSASLYTEPQEITPPEGDRNMLGFVIDTIINIVARHPRQLTHNCPSRRTT